jgi:hypothetical protein
MGREVRRVPPNWKHPKTDDGTYHPMFEDDYLTVLNVWIRNHELWLKGAYPNQKSEDQECEYTFYAQYDGNPPDIEHYNRFYKPTEATWYQLYETVSQGTPITPPFATQEELINYLVENGDFWYQKMKVNPYYLDENLKKPTIDQAKSLVETGYACTFLYKNGKIMDAYQQQDEQG